MKKQKELEKRSLAFVVSLVTPSQFEAHRAIIEKYQSLLGKIAEDLKDEQLMGRVALMKNYLLLLDELWQARQTLLKPEFIQNLLIDRKLPPKVGDLFNENFTAIYA